MKVKCMMGQLQDNNKVRYTLVSVDNDGVKISPVEANVVFLDGVDLTVGKVYELTNTFQEVVPQ